MKKIYNIILLFILFFLIMLPLRKSQQIQEIKIDGIFEEWNNVLSLEHESFYNDKLNKNIKNLKYYMDDEYLYLYVEKYYYDENWNVTLNVFTYEDEEVDVINSVELKECDEIKNCLNIEYLKGDSDEVRSIDDDSFIVNNKLEARLSLEKLYKDLNGRNLKFEILLGAADNSEAEMLSDADVIINTGAAFEKKYSIIFIAIVSLIGLTYISHGYNKLYKG